MCARHQPCSRTLCPVPLAQVNEDEDEISHDAGLLQSYAACDGIADSKQKQAIISLHKGGASDDGPGRMCANDGAPVEMKLGTVMSLPGLCDCPLAPKATVGRTR